MKIVELRDHPHHVEELARWHHEEWAYLSPGKTLEQRTESFRSSLESDTFIPSAFIAVDGEELLGSAGIISTDMETRQDLTPWLAGVYVKPAKRQQGIGSALVAHAMLAAEEAGIGKL